MLKDEDRIFKNLYNDFGWEIDSALKRGDWLNTKEIIISHIFISYNNSCFKYSKKVCNSCKETKLCIWWAWVVHALLQCLEHLWHLHRYDIDKQFNIQGNFEN